VGPIAIAITVAAVALATAAPISGDAGAAEAADAAIAADAIAVEARAAEPAPEGSAVELSLPFTGVWVVMQGFDSGDTHTGYAAFALDFAPPQDLGRFARLAHPRLTDFGCYGRPVLAPADGQVVRVATGFPDRPPYARSKRTPRRGPAGGNYVMIQHAPRVYTELVHLQARSVVVRAGQTVSRGQVIGRCGNSGNATTPHLHLGLLTAISPITTGRMKLARYQVLGADRRWIAGDGEPRAGQWIRPAGDQSSGR
jgi:hypothetical protein